MDPPKQGAIIDGYAYLGGDPSKMESWKKADAAPEAVAATGAPRVGQVVDGHAYLGGDPSKQESWKAQKNYDAADVPLTAISNLPASALTEAGNMVEGVKHMVQHPVDTASTFARLGISTNPLAPILGLVTPHLPEGVREKVQPALDWLNEPKNAMMQEYAEKYGGWENFKRTVAENPVSFLMDATTPFTGGVGAGAKATKVGKVGQFAAKASDPVSVASTLTKKALEPAATSVIGKATGVGEGPLREAARTGLVGGTEGINFRQALREGVPTENIVDTARSGLQNIKDKAQADYVARRNDPTHGWAQDPTTLNFAPIEQKWHDVLDSMKTKAGTRKIGEPEWNKMQEIGEVINEWKFNPLEHTAEGFDGLKQRIRAIYPDGVQPQVQRAVTTMAHAVTGEITKQAKGYAQAMKNYSKASDDLWEMEKAFSLGKESSIYSAMSKLQTTMRNDAASQQAARSQILGNLEREGNISIRPQLAGAALHTNMPRGIAGAMTGAGMGAGLPVGVAAVMSNPIAAAAAIPGLAMASPRLMGEMYHGMGRLAGAPGRALDKYAGRFSEPIKDVGRGAFSPMARQIYRMEGDSLPPEEQRARGGYLRRKASH